jgi:hypothetical protein
MPSLQKSGQTQDPQKEGQSPICPKAVPVGHMVREVQVALATGMMIVVVVFLVAPSVVMVGVAEGVMAVAVAVAVAVIKNISSKGIDR